MIAAARYIALAVTAIVLGVTHSSTAVAKTTWHKYENSHFVVYSDERRGTVLDLLEGLELFRAAAIQVANIDVPEDAPRPRVVIFASRAAFKRFAGRHTLAGFTSIRGDVPHFFLYARGKARLDDMRIRHEYAHILLSYKQFRYPAWFDEGFARLMSTLTFRQDNTLFAVGETEYLHTHHPSTPWDEVLSDNFDAFDLSSRRQICGAYAQSWFLTHYFMLGDDFTHTDELAEYFRLLAAGTPSITALETVVGESVDVFAKRVQRDYRGQKIKYVTYRLDVTPIDTNFTRSVADPDALSAILDKYRGSFKKN